MFLQFHLLLPSHEASVFCGADEFWLTRCAPVTSPKRIDREGLGKRLTETERKFEKCKGGGGGGGVLAYFTPAPSFFSGYSSS